MDAVEFLNKYNRMCKYYEGCTGCPIQAFCFDTVPEEMINAVEKWAEDHPQKTMMQDFFEKFPNAPKREDNTPCACPAHLGYVKGNNANYWESECNEFDYNCVKCWSRLLED